MNHGNELNGLSNMSEHSQENGEDLGRLIRDACFCHLTREEHLECRKTVQNFLFGKMPVRQEADVRLQGHMHLPAESLPGDHLRPEEQEEARLRLAQFMQAHPHRSFQAEPSESIVESFFENLAFLTRAGWFRGVAAFCVLLIVGNSVALAASETLPGDTLYPVKINVIEPARAMVTVTAAGRAQWASNCVRRRLAEAEKMIAQKQLTPDHWATIQASMNANLETAKRHIDRVAASDPESAADLSADLETTLVAHSTALSDVEVEGDDVISAVALEVGSAASVAAELNGDLEEQVAADEATAERIAVRAMNNASSAVGDLDISASAMIEVAAPGHRVKEARMLLEDANKQLQSRQFKQSMSIARQAARKAEEGKAFLHLGLEVDTGVQMSSDSSLSAGVAAMPTSSCGTTVYSLSSQAVIIPASVPVPSVVKKSSSSKVVEVKQSSSVQEKEQSSESSSTAIEVQSSVDATIDLPVPGVPSIPLPTLPSLP